VEQGDRTASLPEETPPDEVTVEAALKLLDQAQQGEEPLGIDPATHKPVYLKVGRFGPYVQRGLPDDEEKPQNASLLKGMNPADIDLATALKLLSLPRNLGDHPEHHKPVMAYNGRFGPYVKCGEETRSLPADISPLDVTLDQAIFLLAQPKTRGRGAAAKKEPLRVFEKPSPVTEKAVQILDGRYGAYITDGETNVSLRKGMSVEELTYDEALAMLADKAAQSPPKKKASRKPTAKKAAPKKGVSKRATAKKSAKKSSNAAE
jgi:DNA topoisomerase-1